MTTFAAIFNNDFYVVVEAENINEAFKLLEKNQFSSFTKINTLSALYQDYCGSIELSNYAIISEQTHDFVYGEADSNGYFHLKFVDTEYINENLNKENLDIPKLIEKFDTQGKSFLREFKNTVFINKES